LFIFLPFVHFFCSPISGRLEGLRILLVAGSNPFFIFCD
jgi:hypothetical protein